jgi:hypothetical protein
MILELQHHFRMTRLWANEMNFHERMNIYAVGSPDLLLAPAPPNWHALIAKLTQLHSLSDSSPFEPRHALGETLAP